MAMNEAVCNAYAERLRKAWDGHDACAYLQWLADVSPDKLIELIERPTCHEAEMTEEEGYCGPTLYVHKLSCGHEHADAYSYAPLYCPSCGALVVPDE